MESYLSFGHFDLVTPDGYIQKLEFFDEKSAKALVAIENISPAFIGFQLDKSQLTFNFKSVLAQLGLNGIGLNFQLSKGAHRAEVEVEIKAYGRIGKLMLSKIEEGAYVGRIFAKDERRRIKDPDYLSRMFGRVDREGRPLLSLARRSEDREFRLEKINGFTAAFLPTEKGKIVYLNTIRGLLPTIAEGLKKKLHLRSLLKLHQRLNHEALRVVNPDKMLLLTTSPLHIRTVFAKVVGDLLPPNTHHTTADILQPDTRGEGDIYEFYGDSAEEITHIPLEFYKLEPHREHVFYSDRDQLQLALENPNIVFETFKTSPVAEDKLTSTFIVKGSQLHRLKESDWIVRDKIPSPFLGVLDPLQQGEMVERYIEKQPTYPFLKGIEIGEITSQGVLFMRYFPSPLMKRMLLSYYVHPLLKGIYFQYPSFSSGYYFSQEDQAMLMDLATFGIPIYWADETSQKVLQYVQRPQKSSGMFVPMNEIETFKKATFFGVYGSNLLAGNFENELKDILKGLLDLKNEVDHPLLHKNTPIALVTGGGPGAMEVGNRAAKELGILSCAHVVDFRQSPEAFIHEQKQNPFVEAKMTYRLDQLIERQAKFYLDFPIFVMGGIGTDFELSLEELRRKVTSRSFTPIILFGEPEYWRKKITSRFKCNMVSGTIKGSEWVSNNFFCVQKAELCLQVYRDFFEGKLPLGPDYPIHEDGFVVVE